MDPNATIFTLTSTKPSDIPVIEALDALNLEKEFLHSLDEASLQDNAPCRPVKMDPSALFPSGAPSSSMADWKRAEFAEMLKLSILLALDKAFRLTLKMDHPSPLALVPLPSVVSFTSGLSIWDGGTHLSHELKQGMVQVSRYDHGTTSDLR